MSVSHSSWQRSRAALWQTQLFSRVYRRSLRYDLGKLARLLAALRAFPRPECRACHTDLFLNWQATFGQASRQTWQGLAAAARSITVTSTIRVMIPATRSSWSRFSPMQPHSLCPITGLPAIRRIQSISASFGHRIVAMVFRVATGRQLGKLNISECGKRPRLAFFDPMLVARWLSIVCRC